MNSKERINVAFQIKGSTVLTLVWIFKRISPSCFGKKYITYLRWLFLTSLRFFMKLLGKICGFMGGFALLLYIYSAYVS